jgi:hypothetical protein
MMGVSRLEGTYSKLRRNMNISRYINVKRQGTGDYGGFGE